MARRKSREKWLEKLGETEAERGERHRGAFDEPLTEAEQKRADFRLALHDRYLATGGDAL